MSVGPHPHNPGQWIIDCRPGGYKGPRERIPFVGTRQEAVDLERVIMRRHADMPKVTPKSLGMIYRMWMVWYAANRAVSTVEDVRSVWKNRLAPVFETVRPNHLTRAMLEQYKLTRLKSGVKPRTISKELNYFSGMLKWAVDNEFCEALPFQITGFSRKQTAPPKPRPLTPEQVTLLLNNIEPQFRLIFLLMADCGLRLTEATRLLRSQVEFDHGVIFVIGKGSKERIVPITTDRLRQELEKAKGMKDFLTLNPQTKKPYVTIRTALIRAAKKAEIDKRLYHHLLRHSFGTNATAAHIDLSALQRIMGHSSSQTTAMYQHLAGEYLRSEGSKLNDMVNAERPHGHSGQ
ncbi:MAG: tyrosine-type recombinase/integrase [Desulfobulbaceae bacterium]|nr:tyrosine-type recombinase/integrase [Desulfobulbaceae bacterium]